MECIVLGGWNNGHILKKVVYIFYDVWKVMAPYPVGD